MSLLRAIIPPEVVEFFNQVNRIIRVIPTILIILTVSAVLYDWVWLLISYLHLRDIHAATVSMVTPLCHPLFIPPTSQKD